MAAAADRIRRNLFSILPAFAIDAGWDRHQQRLEEAELLAGLEEEFESNSALLAHLDALNRRAAIVFGGFPDVLQALGNVRPPNEIGDSRRTAIGREVVVEAA